MFEKIKTKFFGKENKNFRDQTIVGFSMLFMNIMNAVFHLVAGRKLGPEDYGLFGALLYIMYFMTVPLNTIQLSISKFTTRFNIEKNNAKISYMYKRAIRKMLIWGLFAFIAFLLISPLLIKFFHVSESNIIKEYSPFFITGLFLVSALLLPIPRGILQGLQKFLPFGSNLLLEGLIKIGFGVLLLIFGFGLDGALFTFLASYIIAYFVASYSLKDIKKTKPEKFDTKILYGYSYPVIITLTVLTAMYTVDMILIKNFLSLENAGFYAALSTLGKVVFFGSLSVSNVLFPKISEIYESKIGSLNSKEKEHRKVLFSSLLIVFLFGMCGVAFFYFLHNQFISLTYGIKYLPVSNLLWLFSLAMTFFAMSYTLCFYNLSRHKYNFIPLIVIGLIMEIFIIFKLKSNIASIVKGLDFLMIILFVILFVETIFISKKLEIKKPENGEIDEIIPDNTSI
ncbi:oligosaccharide flippase family protein [Candidatus Woesearchaeota archaeon]|nr:oligosaccharide flippase family protein [Candidatus Woesearchaeota archaeon]